MRIVFARARRSAPCLVVLEDLDSLIKDENRAFLLNELDGFADNEGVVVIASTNHPEKLDPAILDRPSHESGGQIGLVIGMRPDPEDRSQLVHAPPPAPSDPNPSGVRMRERPPEPGAARNPREGGSAGDQVRSVRRRLPRWFGNTTSACCQHRSVVL